MGLLNVAVKYSIKFVTTSQFDHGLIFVINIIAMKLFRINQVYY